MSRKLLFPVLFLTLLLCSCGKSETARETATYADYDSEQANVGAYLNATYEIHVSDYAWGPSVDRVQMLMDAPLDAVSREDFTIVETKATTNYDKEDFPVETQSFPREILDAYLADENGTPVAEPSKVLVLSLSVSPESGNPLNYNPATGLNTWCSPYYMEIEQASGRNLTSCGQPVRDLSVRLTPSRMVTSADDIALDSFTSSDRITYPYAHFEPVGGSDTLLVWLHGGGEGGTADTDPRIPMLASRALVLMREEFQNEVGGINILIPQCPTLWMDMNGGGRIEDILSLSDGTSFYTESLKELIDVYREETSSEKVILAGCSNGGFMSLLLALTYPEDFDGIIPICETLRDENIGEDSIQKIASMPMYFIYSKDDSIALPELNSVPTIKRLRALDAPALHVAASEHVIDSKGTTDENGDPYQYMGHWSWIYFFNNETRCETHGESAWEFIHNLAA